jgi:hypothetical protein
VQEFHFIRLAERLYILVLDLLIHVSGDIQKQFLENYSWEGNFVGDEYQREISQMAVVM